MFINRDREISALRGAAAEPPQLVVLTGRRRVGKSALLEHSLTGSRVLSFQADEQDEQGQLQLLADEAAGLLPGRPPIRFDSWPDALDFIGAQATEGALTVILDEFQWLCAAQVALPSMIQRAWDRWERAGTPVTLILSGSALTFMDGLLANGSPLYGRATLRPRLTPLGYRDAALFVKQSPEQAIRRYAILGGTPQYHVWAGALPLSKMLRERVLERGAPMYEEPLNLLRQGEGVRTPSTYLSVLRVIAGGATQHNAIATQTSLSTANLSEKLARLRALGYVRVREPVGPAESPARGTYELADPFFRFWFRYVFPRRSRLERGRVGEVLGEIQEDLDNLIGPTFEECCREWVGVHATEQRVGGELDEIGSWRSRDGQTEIDVVGIRRGRYALLGSCKWRRRADERVLDELIEARDRMGKAGRARLAVFAREDFTDGLRARAREEDVLLVTLADLYGP